MTAGRSRWFPRGVSPVRPGTYECGVKITNSQPVLFLWKLEWDGVGFLTPIPMIVVKWRGMTKAAHALVDGAQKRVVESSHDR